MSLAKAKSAGDFTIALAGNPNTGKSTVFNGLTGLNQHTGNWPGKTVKHAWGKYLHKDQPFVLVDLPGTYSLLAGSVDEGVARDFICFGEADATVVVADATSLERNLNIILQVLEITDRVVVCVNLLDEAARKKIHIDLNRLAHLLGVPVVGTNARDGVGLQELKETVYQVVAGEIKTDPIKIRYDGVVEQATGWLEAAIKGRFGLAGKSRWIALRLIEGDLATLAALREHLGTDIRKIAPVSAALVQVERCLLQKGLSQDELRDCLVSAIVKLAEEIRQKTVRFEDRQYNRLDRQIDRVLTSSTSGILIMLALLGGVFWLTIQGANYPSRALATLFFWLEAQMTNLFWWAGWPTWLHGALVLGVYRTLAWVIAVMLPPMAIFFPLFTLLEDLGYLPRVAFNLDKLFKRACAHGKQALTMCMGFGCNAAGVISCRIIDSPRERLIAIITNNFVPCNGRFPTLIALATIFIAGSTGRYRSVLAALAILAIIVLGVMTTLLVSSLLSKTILKGLPSSFTLELPPYRKPQLGQIIIRSILDRTLFVLSRAVLVAAPAGLLIWVLANVYLGESSVLQHMAQFLGPFAYWLGLDGYILLAFILGFPANEIVIPILVMSYMASGNMVELNSLRALQELLLANGWTWLTGVCTMLFCLNHFPCGTTILTILKETQSKKWPLVAFFVPTITGIMLCFVVAQTVRWCCGPGL